MKVRHLLAAAGLLVISSGSLSAKQLVLDLDSATPYYNSGQFLTEIEMWNSPMADHVQMDGSVFGTHYFSNSTNVSGVDAGLTHYGTSGRIRLMDVEKVDPSNKDEVLWGPRLGYYVQQMRLNTDGDIYPSDFTHAQVNLGTGLPTSWTGGLGVILTGGVGFAGTNAFGDANGIYFAGSILTEYKIDENDALNIGIDYNGNRTFMPDVPLPGIVWKHTRGSGKSFFLDNKDFVLKLGLPANYFRYYFDEFNLKFLLEVSYVLPESVGGRILFNPTNEGFFKDVSMFASYSTLSDAWHDNNLPRGDDRIIFEQSMAELGMRYAWDDETKVIFLAGGYAFGREFRTGFDTRDSDKSLELDDTPYIRLEGQFSF